MKNIILSLSILFFAVSCKESSNNITLSDKDSIDYVSQLELDNHNSKIGLDWEGNYEGLLPCADCPGIETYITLFPDNTYELKSVYQGDNKFEDIEQGSFEWSKDGNQITFNNEDKSKFKIGENQLWYLDREGKVVTGELEEFYILKKKK